MQCEVLSCPVTVLGIIFKVSCGVSHVSTHVIPCKRMQSAGIICDKPTNTRQWLFLMWYKKIHSFSSFLPQKQNLKRMVCICFLPGLSFIQLHSFFWGFNIQSFGCYFIKLFLVILRCSNKPLRPSQKIWIHTEIDFLGFYLGVLG